MPFTLGAIPINCPYGYIGKVNSVGVIPSTSDDKTICHVDIEDLTPLCPLQGGLNLTVLASYNRSNPFNKFTFSNESIFDHTKTVSANCLDINAKLFVNFNCFQDKAVQETKHQQTSIIACLGVLLVLVYLTVLHYFKRASDLNQMQWDIQTITPGDYTAQFEISEKAYTYFMNYVYPRDQQRKSDISIGESLKTYLKKELEHVLTEKLNELKS